MKILVCSYASDNASLLSLQTLWQTIKRHEVIVWDNCYPLGNNRINALCWAYGFYYRTSGRNEGMYHAFNTLLEDVQDENVILFDGDCMPDKKGWVEAMEAVLQDKSVGTVTLSNSVIEREMNERGFDRAEINGVRVKIPHSVCTNTVCGFNTQFLKDIGGLRGSKKYYGGNEIEMWKHYGEKKWVYLEDFREETEKIQPLHDWQYQEFKLLYAHRNIDMSFEDYLLSKPIRHGFDNLIKQIFG